MLSGGGLNCAAVLNSYFSSDQIKNMESLNGLRVVIPTTRKVWREWLKKNHDKERAVWLVIFGKEHRSRGISQAEAVEEALCFGWIDSKSIRRDDESRYQWFSPRKPKSNWSKINRERVERLTNEGLMTPAGQALIDLAKASGTWEALVEVENNVVPDDLRKAFRKSKVGWKNFQAFSPSSQRIILQWIHTAKKAETRQQRIERTVMMAEKNLKAYP